MLFFVVVPTPHCTPHSFVYEINMSMKKWDQLINDHKKNQHLFVNNKQDTEKLFVMNILQ